MKTNSRLAVVLLFIGTGTFMGISGDGSARVSSLAFAEAGNQQASEKTAEQVYRNIQILKGVPAAQLQQVMALFTGSLGVKCSHCHTNQFDKDDKPAKQTARLMIKMVFDINKGTFGGRDAITCYSCHRGKPNPDSVLVLGANPWLVESQSAAATPEPASPSVEQILDRYVRASGGKELMAKLTTRISKGSRIGADGVMVPEEVYQKAPNKLVVITRYPGVPIMLGLNGRRAWAADRDKVNEITGEELIELEREAAFHKDLSIGDLYTTMKVSGRANVGGKEAYVIEARSRSGNSERLYFDTQNGLLIRRYRESRTVLGQFPLQTDYDDYQIVDGLKLPLTIRWSMPGRSWSRRIAEVKHNVSIDDEQFDPPVKR